MKLMRGAALAAVLCLGLVSAHIERANATVIEYVFGNEFSGGQTLPSPFATATISDVTGGVTIGINLLSNLGGAFVTGAYFNYGTTATDVAALAAAAQVTGGTQPPLSVQIGSNAFKADGDGLYDVLLNYQNSSGPGRFTAGEFSSLTFLGGVTASMFDNFSAPSGGHGPFQAVLRVQGIGPNAEGSGWFAPVAPVPGPLVGAGLPGLLAAIGSLVFLARSRRRRMGLM